MEIDDDFGDLYSDVLLPVSSDTSKPPPSPPPPNPNPSLPRNAAAASSSTSVAAAPAVDDVDDDWLLGGAASPTVDPTSNWADEDEETNANPSADEKPRASASSPEMTVQEKNQAAAVTADVADQEDVAPVIPGLGAAVGPAESGDDWDDSDSEDDLQIVLNDTEHGAKDDLGYGDGDEEEDLVIVTNDDQIGAMDQDWGEDGAGPAVEGEGKEGDGSKVAGVGGPGGTGPVRIGYSNHAFHQHHSMYKYVRPGAPVPGGPAGGVAGPQGQLRPPLPTGPYPGRGRGDWRPAGGRMMNGRYGMSAWGNMRPSGLDFSLPPQKTIFDFDIENFEEKPWRHPGAESSDYFNFNLDEAGWKDYCKRLGQLKIESTMQSKIRVYESGRSEPEFDPDLPPELAAAAKGHNVISPDNATLNAKDNGQVDFSSHTMGHPGTRPPLPTGRAIQVEGGYGERLPSIDTRPPRLRESDSVIEIVLQDSIGDFTGADNNDQAAVQTERGSCEDADVGDSSEPLQSHRSRHRTRSPVHQDDRGDSWGRDSDSTSAGYTRREKSFESTEDKPLATKEAAMKNTSVDERSDDHDERLAYTTDVENDEVNFDEPESPSKNQKENSLLETRRSDTSRCYSRSDKEEEVVQVPRSKPSREAHRASRRSDGRIMEMERGRMVNPNNNMRWREGNEMYYHPHMNGRDRDFVPPPHAFRGRSYERFREDGVMHARRFREEEIRMDPRAGKRITRNFEREEDVRVRKRVEETDWRGPRKRDRDEGIDAHLKRRKEEEAPRRGKVEREDMIERKRDRDEANHRLRDKVVVEDHYRSKHREEGSRHREREERQRSKHTHEMEESRVATRTHGKEEPKVEDRERKMRDKQLNGSSIEKGSSRQERGSHDGINRTLVPEKERHKDSSRRSRGSEGGMEPRSKRRHDDRDGRLNEKSDVKGIIDEQENSKKILERSEAPPRVHHDHYTNPPEDTEDPNSDNDGTHDDSRRGRSKLERWTSHKERDYTAISTSLRAPEDAVPSESKSNISGSNTKKAVGDEAMGQASSDNRHLDTAERLKRRSERFKLPMPGEKEVAPPRQADNELVSNETEVKHERPPRKRRWTGN
ncbi:FIP1 -like protein [Rhynchospora pubera]|uniref:FIP1 -like protein n=1 Tax=Rhynchospora pubera TaxID=906938 RepID=A0AAV8D4A2_9POAL|nr:FIP1 -like protein [Rhynchospora pubera]